VEGSELAWFALIGQTGCLIIGPFILVGELVLLGPSNYSLVEGSELALVCSGSGQLAPTWRKQVKLGLVKQQK